MSRNESPETPKVKTVPLSSIFVDPKINSRRKLTDIPELAKSIKTKGLLIPLLVTNGGSQEKPYTLQGGHRRVAAMQSLGWKDEMVNVVIVPNNPDANLIENVVRVGLPALDLAERVVEMCDGTYYVPEGEEARKYSKDEIGQLLGKSTSHIQNYARIHMNLTDEVKTLVRPHDPSARVLVAWAAMKPEKQLEAAKEWVSYQEKLVKAGKKRNAKKGKEEGGGSGKPGKKFLVEKFEQLTWKASAVRGKEGEIAAAAAQILGFVLAMDGFKRFPSEIFSAEDAKAFKAAMKAAEAADEAAEVDEE